MEKLPSLQMLDPSDLPQFFAYIDAHLKENGVGGTPLFQPQSRRQNGLLSEKQVTIRDGLSIAIGLPGWRRVWAYRTVTGAIAGHIDLRARPEPFTLHRALLGMGSIVHCAARALV